MISVWIVPAASSAVAPRRSGRATASLSSPAVKNVISSSRS